jgi:chemotaxis regulatin CheY-phosphate phosphatase CheZ
MSSLIKNSIEELKALVQDTEDCANKILESAENIEKELKKIEDKEIFTAITSHISKIFEAAHFQDFSGQRASKVISNLEEIEDKVGDVKSEKNKSFEEGLKSGPQLEAANQEDIDSLFND